MDVSYFLKERTKLIRYIFENGEQPFREIQRKIGAEEEPFIPPYSEDSEPAFVAEWMDAEAAVELLGLSCISMLSDSIKLYFNTLQSEIGFVFTPEEQKPQKEKGVKVSKPGFVEMNAFALGVILDTDWVDSHVDFGLVEQIVLARNRVQHGEYLTSFRVQHDPNTMNKFSRPYFISEAEERDWNERDGDVDSFFKPHVEVGRDKLFAAIKEVEKLADYVDSQMDKAREWKRKARSAATVQKQD